MSRHTPPAIAFAVAMAGIAVFSCMDALMKGLTLEIGTYNTLLWRSFAGAAIAAMPHFRRRPGWPAASVLAIHVRRGAVATVMAVTFFWGLARVPMAQAVALTFIAPLIALFLAAWLLKERIDRSAILASLIALAGVATILAGQARAELGEGALLGAISILFSAVCYAYNIILMRRQALVADGREVAFYQNIMVGLFLALAAPWLAVVPDAVHLPALAGAALLATISLFLLTWAYGRAEASYLAPVEYTAFIWASILGYLVFGEHVGAFTVAGAMLIAGGCLLAARRKPVPMGNLEGAQ
ncbi:DMT family transporter [Edaphosphingomonas haloaromaticamans]|uniref:EamA-like transporter family protein n=1 Tax=Edaphosphingomonas haloaromaticamans TaxID=653954 RepID=A0A1S1HJK6_9SPHN|nr:DMT family transporter [Sphingomonas haloaromaticamans]OHT22022.1 EamA-like transporter family protein [Sphingomonas haloaromaticamans]